MQAPRRLPSMLRVRALVLLAVAMPSVAVAEDEAAPGRQCLACGTAQRAALTSLAPAEQPELDAFGTAETDWRSIRRSAANVTSRRGAVAAPRRRPLPEPVVVASPPVGARPAIERVAAFEPVVRDAQPATRRISTPVVRPVEPDPPGEPRRLRSSPGRGD